MDMSTQNNKVVVSSCHGHVRAHVQKHKVVVSSCHGHEHTHEQGRGAAVMDMNAQNNKVRRA